MRTVILSEDTVETLIAAARLGIIMMDHQQVGAEDRYERSNIRAMMRRTEAAIQNVEGMIIGVELEKISTAQRMSEAAERKRVAEDYSEAKTNWIEGRR